MKAKGRITKWDEERGFGFITPQGRSKQVFVHISDITFAGSYPETGSRITYELATDDKGRPQARNATLAGSSRVLRSSFKALCLSGLFFYALNLASQQGLLPRILLWNYTFLSLTSFLFYARDKSAAKNDSQRTAEKTLHMLDLAGGWPGALVARQLFRHKSSKRSFRRWFWATVIFNLAALGYLLVPQGQWLADVLGALPYKELLDQGLRLIERLIRNFGRQTT